MEIIHGAPSFSLFSDLVSLYVTCAGGHLAPVEFRLGDRTVSPYALAPWMPDEIDSGLPVLLKNLRGDFMCLPFGPQDGGPPHGVTANHEWSLIEKTQDTLALVIEATDVCAKVTKTITLRPDHTAIYYAHSISGLEGGFSYGNHPILDISKIPSGKARLSVSPFRWASVYPEYFSNPADGAHQALKIGAIFTDLAEVPLAEEGTTDLTHYPARPGSDDLVMMVAEESTPQQPFAWSAVVMDGYVWFSLKDPADFPATMFWLSNGGRSAPPWDSVHTARLGVEDICSHFCDSVDISRKDLLRNLSIPTTKKFSKNQPVTLRNIQAVAAVPQDFGQVKSIVPSSPTTVTITDEHGVSIDTLLDWRFLSPENHP